MIAGLRLSTLVCARIRDKSKYSQIYQPDAEISDTIRYSILTMSELLSGRRRTMTREETAMKLTFRRCKVFRIDNLTIAGGVRMRLSTFEFDGKTFTIRARTALEDRREKG